jgi:hypothetical protein
VIGQSLKLLRLGNHEHLILLVNPPMLLSPLLVVQVDQFGEKLVFVGFVVRDVAVE